MKKLLLAVIALTTLSACNPTSENSNTTMLDAEYTYELDVVGINPHIYQITHSGNDSMTCLVLIVGIGNNKSSNIECFPKNSLIPSYKSAQHITLLKPVYQLSTYGKDHLVFEFTPSGSAFMTCLALVAGSNKAGDIDCFHK
jgi:hypothetical protein